MLIDRADGAINICEMKYAKDEFVIDANYEQRLRERMSSFAVATKTKKALLHTFITTYGVKRNTHSGWVNSEVKMNDLLDREQKHNNTQRIGGKAWGLGNNRIFANKTRELWQRQETEGCP